MQFDDPDYAGGANKVSLNNARHNYQEFGAKTKDVLSWVKKSEH